MVVLKASPKTQETSPLSITPKNEEMSQKKGLFFSNLYESFKNDKSTQNETQSKTKIASTEESEQNLKKRAPKTFADLMQISSETVLIKSEKSEISLNPQITEKLTPNELKALINEAKKYLKAKIMQTDGFRATEIESLPKTLKGLIQVAQKLGLDLTKISLEEVKTTLPQTSKEQNLQVSKTQAEVNGFQKQTQRDNDVTIQTREEKKLKDTPLFKAQNTNEITTQEIVSAKAVVIEMKKPKERGSENLKLLLRGEVSQKNDVSLTADFSVATAKVIAPTLAQMQPIQTIHNLESFLQGKNTQTESTLLKPEMMLASKGESLEVKMNEAKQMMRYLSSDIKTAIEDYKSPFTRVKVQLNPQSLGEVDLTVVQRGKNLHVTLSSNNAAINTLAMNAHELKAQLSNSGIQNATLNFNSNSQHQDGAASQQHNGHQQRRDEAHKGYLHSQSEDINEEILSSLEIVVSYYA